MWPSVVDTVETEPGRFQFRVTIRRFGVYLDNHSLIDLSKPTNAILRERFILSLHRGADLMFSPINAMEILGPQRQRSVDQVRSFLNEIGPYWFPIESSVMTVIEREAAGADTATACTCEWMIKKFFAAKNIHDHGEQRVYLAGPEFFRLGFLLDWLPAQRATLQGQLSTFEADLRRQVDTIRRLYDHDRTGFERVWPKRQFESSSPVTFAFWELLRLLMLDAKGFKFKKGDGADLCHAVIAAAFARFATLDKQWKQRVARLPKPNHLATIYYAPELERLVDDLEAALAE